MTSLSEMNIRELAAQIVMARVSAGEYFSGSRHRDDSIRLVEEGIGGFCVFSGNKEATSRMIEELQSKAKFPLIFSADFENGTAMRLYDGTAFPHAMALGRANDTAMTFEIARAIACEAKSVGITWNLAPVCDVNSNSKNPIINIRSYGEEAEIVGKHIEEYINGLHSENVMSCAKHFPGHGDTESDSHISLPVLNYNMKRMESLELKPFVRAIGKGVKSIMTGHIAVPALDSTNVPASLSHTITTGLLREKLGFGGIIITDALDMKSISDSYSSGEAALKAVHAGADIVLMPVNPIEAIDSIAKEAVANPDFKEKVYNSAKKLYEAKEWSGLINGGLKKITKVSLNEYEKLALKAGFKAIDIIGKTSLIPLSEDSRIAGFAMLQTEDIEPAVSFFNMLGQAIENEVDFGFVDKGIIDADLLSLKEGIKYADIVIIALFYRARAYQGSVGLSEREKYIIKELIGGKPSIVALFGNPYLAEEIEADCFIRTYSDVLPSRAAAVLKLCGRTPVLI